MSITKIQFSLFCIVFSLACLLQSIFIVHEGERAFILRLGKVVSTVEGQPKVMHPGLHVKIPLIDTIYTMDARNQIWGIESDRIQSVEQVYLMVDFYFKWKIEDFGLFFKVNAAGGQKLWNHAKRNVEILLKQKIKNAVLEEFGRRPLAKLIAEDRQEMMLTFAPAIKQSLKDLGVALVDFRLKQIDLPDDVSERVYNRMRTEREKTATMHRARGLEKAEKIRADADNQVQVCLAQARRDADIIRGQADAEVAKLYAESYSKNPEFYQYVRTLEAYRNTLSGSKDILILKADRKLFAQLEPEVL
jgi:membrane protease subunit HflC